MRDHFPQSFFHLLYITMRDIFEFNHINQTLSKEKVKILKDLYAYATRTIMAMKSCTAVFEEKILFVIFQLAS